MPKIDIPAPPKVNLPAAPKFDTPSYSLDTPKFDKPSSPAKVEDPNLDPQEVRDERAADLNVAYKAANSEAKVSQF